MRGGFNFLNLTLGGSGHPAPGRNFFKQKENMANSDNVLTNRTTSYAYLIPQLGKFPRDQKFPSRTHLN